MLQATPEPVDAPRQYYVEFAACGGVQEVIEPRGACHVPWRLKCRDRRIPRLQSSRIAPQPGGVL